MRAIEIADIPSRGRITIWPYQEWSRGIPVGHAIEITETLNGRILKVARGCISVYFSIHPELGLQVIMRGERLWIAKVRHA